MWGDTITFSAEIKEEMVVKPTMSARGPSRGTVLNSDISRSGGRGGGIRLSLRRGNVFEAGRKYSILRRM